VVDIQSATAEKARKKNKEINKEIKKEETIWGKIECPHLLRRTAIISF